MKIISSCIKEYLDILLVKKKNENDLITVIKVYVNLTRYLCVSE